MPMSIPYGILGKLVILAGITYSYSNIKTARSFNHAAIIHRDFQLFIYFGNYSELPTLKISGTKIWR